MNITSGIIGVLNRTKTLSSFQILLRNSSFRSSPFLEDLKQPKIKYEVTTNPEDWKYVERILPPTVVPNFKVKESYPSGWVPQSPDAVKLPYFVERTKNHMMPVYLKLSFRNIRRLTLVRKIKGDIWLLEKELREFLQKDNYVPLRSQVNEFIGIITFHGDHVNAIKYYLTKKGL